MPQSRGQYWEVLQSKFHLKYTFEKISILKFAQALLIAGVILVSLFSLQIADWKTTFAQYGTDMDKLTSIYKSCKNNEECFGLGLYIAQNKHASPEILELISEHSDHPAIKVHAATNQNISKALLEKFAKDENEWVKKYATQALLKRNN